MCTHVGLLVVVMKHGLLQGLTVSERKGGSGGGEIGICTHVGLLVVVMKQLLQGLTVSEGKVVVGGVRLVCAHMWVCLRW